MPYKLAGCVGKYLSFIQRESDQKRLTYQEVVDAMNQTEAEREPVIWWVSRDAAPGCRIEVWNERPIQNIGGTFYGEEETGLLFSVAEAAALGIECEPGECFRFDLANRRRVE